MGACFHISAWLTFTINHVFVKYILMPSYWAWGSSLFYFSVASVHLPLPFVDTQKCQK